jgi:release factor glutamine methyltransferase
VAKDTFDAIVSNPPYIPEAEILEEQVRNFEPRIALFAGSSGLEIYQRLIPQAWNALKSKGWLLMEIGHGQHEALATLLNQWSEVEFINDLQGIPRIAVARRP